MGPTASSAATCPSAANHHTLTAAAVNLTLYWLLNSFAVWAADSRLRETSFARALGVGALASTAGVFGGLAILLLTYLDFPPVLVLPTMWVALTGCNALLMFPVYPKRLFALFTTSSAAAIAQLLMLWLLRAIQFFLLALTS